MSQVNEQNFRRHFTNPNEKQEKSGVIQSLIQSFTRSKTPKLEKDNNKSSRYPNNNKSDVVQKESKQVINTHKIQIKPNAFQNNSEMFTSSSNRQNHQQEFLNQIPQNLQKLGSVQTTPQSRSNKTFEPYSQQSTFMDFLKREQIEANGLHQNKENKQHSVQTNQENIDQRNKVLQKETLSVRLIKQELDIDLQLKEKSKSQIQFNDISSRNMLQDQTMQIDSNLNRQIDISINKPVLNDETLDSQVWSDEEDNNIAYFTQTDEDNRKRIQNSIPANYQDKTSSEEAKSEYEYSSQNSNEKIQQMTLNGIKIDTISDKKSKENDEEESSEYSNSNQLYTNKVSSNDSRDNQPQQQKYQSFFQKGQKQHLLKNIPLYLEKAKFIYQQGDQSPQNLQLINDSLKQSIHFNKVMVEDSVQEEITLKNESMLEGVDLTYQIKVQLSDDLELQTATILIENFKNLKINCNVYNGQSTNIPTFNITDLYLPTNDIQKPSNNKSLDAIQNVFQLKSSQPEQKYDFVRFQNFEECSKLFQDIILNNLIFDKIKIPSFIQKNIYLYQHKNDDIYLLREVEDYITIQDIIHFSPQIALGFQKLKEDQVLQLFLEILKVYNVFINEKIALPNLSADTIVINYDSLTLSFNNLQNIILYLFYYNNYYIEFFYECFQNQEVSKQLDIHYLLLSLFKMMTYQLNFYTQKQCYPLENASEQQQILTRRQEREKIVNILQILQKSAQINRSNVGVGSSTMIIDSNLDNYYNQAFYELIYNSILNGELLNSIESIEGELKKINKIQGQIQQENTMLNNSSIFLQNVSQIVQKIQSCQNQKNEVYNRKLAGDYKKKRQYLSQFINIFETQVKMKRKRQASSNFFKCQKLMYLQQIYNSLFMKKESLKTLEDLKNLKAECFGVDSVEYLKTLQILCKTYYQQRMYKQLLPSIEVYTEYLRNTLSSQNANELFEMSKFKLKMTKSPTVREDALVLIDFLIMQQKQADNSPTKQLKPQNGNKFIFNLSKLHYLLACSYNQIDELDLALVQFKQSLAKINEEDDERGNSKLQFYCLSNIARIHLRNKKNQEAKAILRNLQQSPLKFAYPVYYQYLGQIEFEEKNYQQAYQYLHQCYVLREDDQKCNRDYLELLLHYILVTLKQFGSSSDNFKKLCIEMKNFTGDYYNLDCLLIIGNLLFDERIFDLAFQKLEQVKGIMNLLIFSEKNNKALYKEYKKRMNVLEEKLQKQFSYQKQLIAK